MPLKQQKNEKRLSLTEKNMIIAEIVRDVEKIILLLLSIVFSNLNKKHSMYIGREHLY